MHGSSAWRLLRSFVGADKAIRDVERLPLVGSRVICCACVPSNKHDRYIQLTGAGGAGLDEVSARCAAVGEALERRASIDFSVLSHFAYGSTRSLRGSGARREFAEHAPFASDQYNDKGLQVARFSMGDSCRWYAGFTLS